MKTKLWILGLSLCLACAAPSVWADTAFEGEVDYQVTSSNGQSTTVAYFLNGTQMRVETGTGNKKAIEIYDSAAKTLTLLFPSATAYQITPANFLNNMQQVPGTLTSTGQTQTIQGVTCGEWVYNSGNMKVDIWAATDMGTFLLLGSGPGNSLSAVAQTISQNGLFPLEMTYYKSGTVIMTMTATSIDAGTLDSSLFQPPPDYHKLSMPSSN